MKQCYYAHCFYSLETKAKNIRDGLPVFCKSVSLVVNTRWLQIIVSGNSSGTLYQKTKAISLYVPLASSQHRCWSIPSQPDLTLKVTVTQVILIQFSSVQFSCSIVSDSLRPHESQHARTPCPSPTSGVHSHSCPSSRWCHPAISSSVIPFPSCPQSLPASGSFPMNQLFAWGGQSTGVSV